MLITSCHNSQLFRTFAKNIDFSFLNLTKTDDTI